jgi:hypothetical protein
MNFNRQNTARTSPESQIRTILCPFVLSYSLQGVAISCRRKSRFRMWARAYLSAQELSFVKPILLKTASPSSSLPVSTFCNRKQVRYFESSLPCLPSVFAAGRTKTFASWPSMLGNSRPGISSVGQSR